MEQKAEASLVNRTRLITRRQLRIAEPICKRAGKRAVRFAVRNKALVFVVLAQLENRLRTGPQHFKVLLVQIRPVALTPLITQL